MTPTREQIDERLPVWEALSDFFLDTELQPDDHERIAKALATSRYSIDEIESILMGEVCPACRLNMLSVAGEWISFGRPWLEERCSTYYGNSPEFKWLFKFSHQWMYKEHWDVVKKRISEIRTAK